MRKFILLLLSFAVLNLVFASEISRTPTLKASEIFLPVGKTGKMISLLELSNIRMKDFETLTGKKLSFIEKLTLEGAQRKLRNTINYDGTLNSRKIEKLMKKSGEGKGFQAGGFFLGFLLGLIGALIAYLINDDQKKNRTKWAWIGFGVVFVIIIILGTTGSFNYFN